ncbi:MAG: MMPL family transporter [Planctomycetes bacterium]|nr:MMPL family transporter [Planctomycetota bacterium]
MFTAIGVLATVGVLFTVLPVFLHRFPVSDDLIRRQSGGRDGDHLPMWAKNIFGFVVRRHTLTCVMWAVVMTTFAFGMTRITTSVSLLKLLDPNTDLIHDYTWLEKNLANLVPMEVVLTIPPERCRTADEHAEADGEQYRLSTLERLNMLRMVQKRIEKLDEISRVMSVATYTPKSTNSGNINADRSADYAKNKSLEENRDALQKSGYLCIEQESSRESSENRELWRVSARVAALGEDGEGVDYGQFVEQLKTAVDPVLVAYQQRDIVVRQLHAAGKKLDGAKICILYRTPDGAADPPETAQESVLRNVLRDSGIAPRVTANGKMSKGPATFDLAKLDAHKDDPKFPEIMANAIKILSEQDAIVLVSAGSDPTAKQLAEAGLQLIDVSRVPVYEQSAALPLAVGDQPRPIRAVYTGMIPLVYKTQRELLFSLKESIMWATVLIAVVMMFVLRSPIAGAISMIPNVFPIVIIFGILGWAGIKVDIGIMMTASVALGVAVDDTVHFLTWFRRGVTRGMDRVEAVMLAYDRCATAMLQTTIIGGLGLAVFATSTFTPTQQFGYLMISMLGAALIGDLLLLPAILVSPLGRFFGGKAPAPAAEMPAVETPSLEATPVGDSLAPIAGEKEPVKGPVQPVAISEIQPKQPEPLFTDAKVASSDQVANATEQLQKELQDGPHAALHAKLRNLRRETSK